MDGKGMRFNKNKTRHDLVPPFAQEQYAKVLTHGARKYDERNWERGMKWTTVLASLKRHILAFERGEDYDPETKLLHTAHAMCNLAFLTEYYQIFPEGDDRSHWYMKSPKIGLDIDEVLADWVKHYTKRFELEIPTSWNFDKDFAQRLNELKEDCDFWMTIPPKINPKTIPFEPYCYITSRGIPTEWTNEWLQKNGFPMSPVYTLSPGESKADIAKKVGINWFVDDGYKNFVELNDAGICCFLFDTPHNQRYEVGYKRIYSLDELPRVSS